MQAPLSSGTKDVIVVGGGPAGSTAARRLALSGMRVLLLEKARFPRYKSCGGALTQGVQKLLDFDISPVVERTVRQIAFTYQGRALRPVRETGDLAISMVMRSSFDNLLLNKAREAGVEVLEGERLSGLVQDSQCVTVQTNSGTSFRGKICIGADGASSKVAVLSGLKPKIKTGLGLSAEVLMPEREGRHFLQETVVLDFGGVASGYRWIFPKAGQYSIGVCTTGADNEDLKHSLNNYITTSKILKGCDVIAVRGHPLPFFWGGRKVQTGRVLLVGDAAGLTDPLTGEGILPAIHSALAAARCVEGFLKGWAPLEAYTETVTEEIAQDFNYATLFAGIFFRRPWTGYVGGVASKTLSEALTGVMMGRQTYEEAYRALRTTFIGKMRRWLVAAFPGEGDLSPPIRAS